MTATNRGEDVDRGLTRAMLVANTSALRASARAVYRAGPESAAAREEAFEMAQWALQSGAGDALSQMSVRFAKGTGPLAMLVRERQDLIARRQGETRHLDMAAGRADAKASQEARNAIVELDTRLAAIDARLTAEFKEYSELANPKPLGLAAVQALLAPTEALALFLDMPRFGKLPEETLAWVVTKEAVHWRSIPLGTRALSDRVATLRCGLDSSSWDAAAGWPQETAIDKQRLAEQQARRTRCTQLLGLELSPAEWPPFDLTRAKLSEVKENLRQRMHQAIPDQGRWLAQVIRGYFVYHAVPTNYPALSAFRYHIERLWLRTLRRRRQKDSFSSVVWIFCRSQCKLLLVAINAKLSLLQLEGALR